LAWNLEGLREGIKMEARAHTLYKAEEREQMLDIGKKNMMVVIFLKGKSDLNFTLVRPRTVISNAEGNCDVGKHALQ